MSYIKELIVNLDSIQCLKNMKFQYGIMNSYLQKF